MKQKQQSNTGEFGFHERLQQELSCYPVKIIHEDGSVTIQRVKDPYFLVNDSWNVDFVGDIKQFVDMMENYKHSVQNVHFRFSSPTVNLEMKYIFYHKLFNDEWSLSGLFNKQTRRLRRLDQFLNEKYPTLHSLLDLDIEKAEREWLFWLHEQGISTQQTNKHVMYGEYTRKSSVASFLRAIHSSLFVLTDFREEWDKDLWDVRVLHDKYGIEYVKSITHYYLDFTKIEKVNIRRQIKRYFKQRLLSKNNFSWGSAIAYYKYLPKFLSFVFSQEPVWKDLKGLKRPHMERYIQWLHD